MKLGPVKLSSLFAAWLPLAVLATTLSLMVYIVGQQDIRLGANDVPLQLAEDTSRTLADGQLPTSALSQMVDIGSSLSPFLVIYDQHGQPTDGSGKLNNQLPYLPSGVFDYARRHSDDRITWQPQTGVRVASIIKYYHGKNSGYVLAGRNLREVENREKLLSVEVLGGWLTALGATYVVLMVLEKRAAK